MSRRTQIGVLIGLVILLVVVVYLQPAANARPSGCDGFRQFVSAVER